jgi:hypothetical protein
MTYTIQDVAELFTLHKNAVSRWLKAGLKTIDRQKPLLIHGNDLFNFIDHRQQSRRVKCRHNEFYCFKCRAPRPPAGNMVDIMPRNARVVDLSAICGDCGTIMHKAGSIRKLPEFRQMFNTATPAPPHITDTANPSLMCDMKGEAQNGSKHP